MKLGSLTAIKPITSHLYKSYIYDSQHSPTQESKDLPRIQHRNDDDHHRFDESDRQRRTACQAQENDGLQSMQTQ